MRPRLFQAVRSAVGASLRVVIFSVLVLGAMVPLGSYAQIQTPIRNFRAKSPLHLFRKRAAKPQGLSPEQVKAAYHLPDTGGQGTIAIIDAYAAPTIEADLNGFSAQFGLALCTVKNGCLEKHPMGKISKNIQASMETTLDVEWAHAIAPQAKILLVQAKSLTGPDLLQAIDYASSRTDVVAVSMSWGGPEFADEISLDEHFLNSSAVFFASSGDQGSGVNWPAVSPYVVAVGGTTLNMSTDGSVVSETAWSGSGGGVSTFESQPAYQQSFRIPRSQGMRAVPDVSFNADPVSGFSIYWSSGSRSHGWYVVGSMDDRSPVAAFT